MFEVIARTTPSHARLRDAIRLGVLAYLAVVLGAGAALRNVHLESSEHGHRYCPEHEQIEAVEHGGGAGHDERDGLAPLGFSAGSDEIPSVHVACALLNALLSRTPVAPQSSSISTPAADVARSVVAFVERFDPSESILSFAPKTSPPAVTA